MKSTETPYGRNWIDITGALPAPLPGWTMGNGNSPPERNWAFWPLTVVIVGSARICRICLFWRSWMVAPRFNLALYSMKFSGLVVANAPTAPATADELSRSEERRVGNECR